MPHIDTINQAEYHYGTPPHYGDLDFQLVAMRDLLPASGFLPNSDRLAKTRGQLIWAAMAHVPQGRDPKSNACGSDERNKPKQALKVRFMIEEK